MEISQKNENGILLVTLEGDFLSDVSLKVKNHLMSLIGSAEITGVVIDFKKVPRIDSTALGVLMIFYRDLKIRGAKLILYGLSPEISEVLTFSKLDSLLINCATLETALEKVR